MCRAFSVGAHLLTNKGPNLVNVDSWRVVLVLLEVEIPHAHLLPSPAVSCPVRHNWNRQDKRSRSGKCRVQLFDADVLALYNNLRRLRHGYERYAHTRRLKPIA